MDFNDDEEIRSQPARRPRHATRVPDDVADDIHRRMAATKVRRMRNKHECTQESTGACTHPNHRRDVDSLLSDDTDHPGVLALLGLDDVRPGYTTAEKQTWLRWIGQPAPLEDAA